MEVFNLLFLWYYVYMKVILLQDIARLGKRGDVKEVADVFATNVLLKNKTAIIATPSELVKWKQKAESQKKKKEIEINAFAQMVHVLRVKDIIIKDKKRDAKGQLFAQIKDVDLAEAIFKITNLSIDPKQINIPTPIKSIGSHFIEIKQGTQRETLKIEVK